MSEKIEGASFKNFQGDQTLCPPLFFWGGGTLYNGLYGEAPPEKGIFFRIQVCERVGPEFYSLKYHERVGKSVIWVCERAK